MNIALVSGLIILILLVIMLIAGVPIAVALDLQAATGRDHCGVGLQVVLHSDVEHPQRGQPKGGNAQIYAPGGSAGRWQRWLCGGVRWSVVQGVGLSVGGCFGVQAARGALYNCSSQFTQGGHALCPIYLLCT